MARQLALSLPHRPLLGRGDFLNAEANRAALAAVDAFPAQPGAAMALHGPAGSGKTHLAHIWASRVGAGWLEGADLAVFDLGALAGQNNLLVALDNAEQAVGDAAGERALFHLLNLVREQKGALLLVGREPAARWPAALPDLASRLRAAAVAGLGAPDDALLAAVLVKLFADRQVAVGEEVIGFLLGRMERSLSAARLVVGRIDALALEGKRKITVPLAAQALELTDG